MTRFWKPFRRFTLENRRQPPAVQQFMAELSRHPRMRWRYFAWIHESSQ